MDLHAFKTFAFFEPAKGQQARGSYGGLVTAQLKKATRAQMERLGYVYDDSNPDLRVNIIVAVRELFARYPAKA